MDDARSNDSGCASNAVQRPPQLAMPLSLSAASTAASRRSLLGGSLAVGVGALLPPPAGALPAVELPLVPRGLALGKAGVTPSAIIKGCWQLSGSHRGDSATDRTASAAAVADFPRFVAAGIDSFDMGPEACGYGPAELVVGEYLRTLPKDAARPLVFSKLCAVGPEQTSMTRDWVKQKLERACSRTGAPRLDLAQLYWGDLAYAQGLVDCALYATEEVAEGRLGALGYTNMDTATLAKLRDAGAEVAAHQIQFSLLDRRPRKEQIAWCLESGCKLLPYGVLAGGLLSDAYLGVSADVVKVDTASKGKYASVLRRAGGWEWFQSLLRVLRAVGDAHEGQSVSNVAARWVLQQPAVGALILGARNAAHVDDHRRLFAFELSAEELGQIEEVLSRGVQSKGDTYAWERGGAF